MTTKNIKQFRKNLLEWFNTYQRKLPWRETDNPYHIWISEVMLQQTQVKKVLEYYQKFVDRFPTIHALAEADQQDILKTWEGFGYYARPRNLHKAAKAVVEEMGGEIPADYAAFRKLPGVGDYIAAAVQSIAFNAPYAAVDGNVKRVLARLFLIDAPTSQTSSAKIFQQKADLLLDPDVPGRFNPAMMELGATVCRPKSPTCLVCPVSELCSAFAAGREAEFPVRVKSKPTPEYHHAVGVIEKNGRVLITQRPQDGLLGGLWEFPGVEIGADETAEAACLRGMSEMVNLSVGITEFLTEVRHAYTHFKVVVYVFRCRYYSGEVVLNGPVDYRWIRLDEIDEFPFPRVNHKFMPLLRDNASSGS